MLKDIITIDNIFSNPDEIVEYANKQLYNKNTDPELFWVGERTKEIHLIDNVVSKKISNEFIHKVSYHNFVENNKYNLRYNWKVYFYFHRLDSTCQFNSSWIHKDLSIYAGVIYLNKNPPANTGTFLIKDEKIIQIENKYNSLVLYNSDYLHSACNGFGENENSRLTLNIFVDMLAIELTKKDYR